eukprot:5283397-Ditylum_brightwellii.AAC.1
MLDRFHQIRSAYHPDAGVSSVWDKRYQLWFLVHGFNAVSSKTFDFGQRTAFDKDGVATQSWFCCIRQYHKDENESVISNLVNYLPMQWQKHN